MRQPIYKGCLGHFIITREGENPDLRHRLLWQVRAHVPGSSLCKRHLHHPTRITASLVFGRKFFNIICRRQISLYSAKTAECGYRTPGQFKLPKNQNGSNEIGFHTTHHTVIGPPDTKRNKHNRKLQRVRANELRAIGSDLKRKGHDRELIFDKLPYTGFDELFAGLGSGPLRADVGEGEVGPDGYEGGAGEQAAGGDGQLLGRGHTTSFHPIILTYLVQGRKRWVPLEYLFTRVMFKDYCGKCCLQTVDVAFFAVADELEPPERLLGAGVHAIQLRPLAAHLPFRQHRFNSASASPSAAGEY
ncbi:bZIP transcription factor family protein [Striga asiatica]|uniref:BZIP transcription factor family protein n=1 Tax=Striga asiatica TaxID=4170 RepID=A0A5A7QG24_STRAF|nr:bZIP transcription factor family protein [Striga asiatica]